MSPDNNPIAQAKVLQQMIDREGLTVTLIAKKLGKSPSFVSNTLRLLSLPEALQDALVSGLISPGHGRALAGIGDQKAIVEAYKQILRVDGSVRMAETLARQLKRKDVRQEKIKKQIAKALNDAQVTLTRSRVQTRITITLKGGYEKTEPLLRKLHSRLIKPSLVKGQ